jgi:hypothetical protein
VGSFCARLQIQGQSMMRAGHRVDVRVPTRAGSAVLMLLLTLAPVQAQAPLAPEAEVKAEFVERFTRFIDWPTQQGAAPERPFVLGVLGSNEVGPRLEQLARARGFKQRKVEVRQLTGPEGVDGCDVVWISHAAQGQLAEVLARTSGKPILTLGDTVGFAEQGVLINLRRRAARIVFEINLAEAKKSGLKFSAQLLALGEIVGPRGPP